MLKDLLMDKKNKLLKESDDLVKSLCNYNRYEYRLNNKGNPFTEVDIINENIYDLDNSIGCIVSAIDNFNNLGSIYKFSLKELQDHLYIHQKAKKHFEQRLEYIKE